MDAPVDKDALVNEIGRLLAEDARANARPWDAYALIVAYDSNMRRFNGFAYDGDGGYATATPTPEPLGETLDALREATRVDDKAPWQACVVRLVRDTRRITLEFEYDDPARWDITPQTLDAVAERVRPG
jgi:hypothetical protein